jgi:hypothetical protein
MIMTRLILMVSLILLWTKEVKADPLHYTLRYRESTERHQSKVAAAGGKQKGSKRRSLQGVSYGTLFRRVTPTIHDPNTLTIVHYYLYLSLSGGSFKGVPVRRALQ